MKAADTIIRTQRMLPEVYSDESRDFQLFTKLMDAAYNSCYYNAESIRYVIDPKNVNSKLLSLFADKFGIDKADAESLTNTEVRYILRSLPYLIRYKGSLAAIRALVNMYFKIYHIAGTYKIEITNKSAVIQNIQLDDHTIILGLETLAQSTKMLNVMSKYLLPPGYSFFVYFYTELDSTDYLVNNDEVTLIYRSTNLNSEINQDIPDFIYYNTYFKDCKLQTYGDGITSIYTVPENIYSLNKVLVGGQETLEFTYDETNHYIQFSTPPKNRYTIEIQYSINDKSKQIIGAVDAIRLNGIDTWSENDFFLGFCKNTDLELINTNIKSATNYDPYLDLVDNTIEFTMRTSRQFSFDLKLRIDSIKAVRINNILIDASLYTYSKVDHVLILDETVPIQKNKIVAVDVIYEHYKNFDVAKFGTTYKVYITKNQAFEEATNQYEQLQAIDEENKQIQLDCDGNTAVFELPDGVIEILNVKLLNGPIEQIEDYRLSEDHTLLIFDSYVPPFGSTLDILLKTTTTSKEELKSTGIEVYKDIIDKTSDDTSIVSITMRHPTGKSTTKYAYAAWKILKEGSLAIVDDATYISGLKSIGEVYYCTNVVDSTESTKREVLWTKLNFNYVSNNTSVLTEITGSAYDVLCLLYKSIPYLWLSDGTEVQLSYKGSLYELPTATDKTEQFLYYCTKDDAYYASINKTWIKCIDGGNSSEQILDKSIKIVEFICDGKENKYTLPSDIQSVANIFLIQPDLTKIKLEPGTDPETGDYYISGTSVILNSIPTKNSSLLVQVHYSNTLTWKCGGDYYIWYNNVWHKYTYPIYFTKLLQQGLS